MSTIWVIKGDTRSLDNIALITNPEHTSQTSYPDTTWRVRGTYSVSRSTMGITMLTT